jgi:hypothetical protein
MSFQVSTTHRLALGVTSLALVLPAPVAGAQATHPNLSREEQQVLASRGIGAPTPPVLEVGDPAAGAPSSRDGFDWGSAGLGAGAVGGLIALAGGLGLVRRARLGPKRGVTP